MSLYFLLPKVSSKQTLIEHRVLNCNSHKWFCKLKIEKKCFNSAHQERTAAPSLCTPFRFHKCIAICKTVNVNQSSDPCKSIYLKSSWANSRYKINLILFSIQKLAFQNLNFSIMFGEVFFSFSGKQCVSDYMGVHYEM